jgi:hypothetical protein
MCELLLDLRSMSRGVRVIPFDGLNLRDMKDGGFELLYSYSGFLTEV